MIMTELEHSYFEAVCRIECDGIFNSLGDIKLVKSVLDNPGCPACVKADYFVRHDALLFRYLEYMYRLEECLCRLNEFNSNVRY